MNEAEKKDLLEMAEVFHLSKKTIFHFITMPEKMPGLSKKLEEKKLKKEAGK